MTLPTGRARGGCPVKKRIVSVLVAGLLIFTTVGASSAGAVRAPTAASYANCDALHKKWLYGVAKSRRAARKQVRTGHYKPHVSRAGYRANRSLDADDDGTACEVSK
jgi:hypothetical protein